MMYFYIGILKLDIFFCFEEFRYMLIFELYKVEFYFDEKIRLIREILEFFFREIYNFYIVYR